MDLETANNTVTAQQVTQPVPADQRQTVAGFTHFIYNFILFFFNFDC